jgi:long-chain acyl-CoA synthetase
VMYGQTEAGPRISYLPPDKAAVHPSSIGLPIPGVTIDLVDDAGGVITEPGREGEMRVNSPAIMMGYAETQADLALGDGMGGVLLTGDLARRDADGLLTITGRRSRFLKLQGNRVGLDEVERFVRTSGREAFCVGVDNWLCVVLEDGQETHDLREMIIANFKFPPRCLEVKTVPRFPRAESGKLRYGELLQLVRPETPA